MYGKLFMNGNTEYGKVWRTHPQLHCDLSPMKEKALLKGPNSGDLQFKDSPYTAWWGTTLPHDSSSPLRGTLRKSKQLNVLSVCITWETQARENKPAAIWNRRVRAHSQCVPERESSDSWSFFGFGFRFCFFVCLFFCFAASVNQPETKKNQAVGLKQRQSCYLYLLPSWGCFLKDHHIHLEMLYRLRPRKLSLGVHPGQMWNCLINF